MAESSAGTALNVQYDNPTAFSMVTAETSTCHYHIPECTQVINMHNTPSLPTNLPQLKNGDRVEECIKISFFFSYCANELLVNRNPLAKGENVYWTDFLKNTSKFPLPVDCNRNDIEKFLKEIIGTLGNFITNKYPTNIEECWKYLWRVVEHLSGLIKVGSMIKKEEFIHARKTKITSTDIVTVENLFNDVEVQNIIDSIVIPEVEKICFSKSLLDKKLPAPILEEPVDIKRKILDILTDNINTTKKGVVYLHGVEGNGKTYAVKYSLKDQERPIMYLDLSGYFVKKKEAPGLEIQKWAKLALREHFGTAFQYRLVKPTLILQKLLGNHFSNVIVVNDQIETGIDSTYFAKELEDLIKKTNCLLIMISMMKDELLVKISKREKLITIENFTPSESLKYLELILEPEIILDLPPELSLKEISFLSAYNPKLLKIHADLIKKIVYKRGFIEKSDFEHVQDIEKVGEKIKGYIKSLKQDEMIMLEAISLFHGKFSYRQLLNLLDIKEVREKVLREETENDSKQSEQRSLPPLFSFLILLLTSVIIYLGWDMVPVEYNFFDKLYSLVEFNIFEKLFSHKYTKSCYLLIALLSIVVCGGIHRHRRKKNIKELQHDIIKKLEAVEVVPLHNNLKAYCDELIDKFCMVSLIQKDEESKGLYKIDPCIRKFAFEFFKVKNPFKYLKINFVRLKLKCVLECIRKNRSPSDNEARQIRQSTLMLLQRFSPDKPFKVLNLIEDEINQLLIEFFIDLDSIIHFLNDHLLFDNSFDYFQFYSVVIIKRVEDEKERKLKEGKNAEKEEKLQMPEYEVETLKSVNQSEKTKEKVKYIPKELKASIVKFARKQKIQLRPRKKESEIDSESDSHSDIDSESGSHSDIESEFDSFELEDLHNSRFIAIALGVYIIIMVRIKMKFFNTITKKWSSVRPRGDIAYKHPRSVAIKKEDESGFYLLDKDFKYLHFYSMKHNLWIRFYVATDRPRPAPRSDFCCWIHESRIFTFGGWGVDFTSDPHFLSGDCEWKYGCNNQLLCLEEKSMSKPEMGKTQKQSLYNFLKEDLDEKLIEMIIQENKNVEWRTVATVGEKPLPLYKMACAKREDNVYIYDCLFDRLYNLTMSESPAIWSSVKVSPRIYHLLSLFSIEDRLLAINERHEVWIHMIERENQWKEIKLEGIEEERLRRRCHLKTVLVEKMKKMYIVGGIERGLSEHVNNMIVIDVAPLYDDKNDQGDDDDDETDDDDDTDLD